MVSSTPLLSESARHVVIPRGIVTTEWPRVVAKWAEFGVEFDPWQHGIGSAALGKRKDGKYAATVGGVVLSIPRQVGKTFLVGAIVIALCLLHPGLTVLWTAHHNRTATKTFFTLKGLTERGKLRPHMLDPRMSNGEQEIRFRNGSRIMFGAREQGFGRGFDEVDVEVFDEAQILSAKALEDMVPATNQSKQAAGALLFFMGTPPRPTDPGEEFTNRRSLALSGRAEDMLYVEMSGDAGIDPNDRAQWARVNPSFPSRTPLESMKRMRANLTDDASFMREGLGVWDNPGASQAIPPDAWASCADPDSRSLDPVVFAVDVDPHRAWSSIVSCGLRADGLPSVSVVEHRRGTDWVVPRLVELYERWSPGAIVLDKVGPVGSLLPDLAKADITPVSPTTQELVQACGAFYDAAVNDRLRHRDEAVLNAALRGAVKRPLNDAWAWARKSSGTDVSPLVAATLALWARQSPAFSSNLAPFIIDLDDYRS